MTLGMIVDVVDQARGVIIRSHRSDKSQEMAIVSILDKGDIIRVDGDPYVIIQRTLDMEGMVIKSCTIFVEPCKVENRD